MYSYVRVKQYISVSLIDAATYRSFCELLTETTNNKLLAYISEYWRTLEV